MESENGDLQLKFKIRGKVQNWGMNRIQICEEEIFVISIDLHKAFWVTKLDCENGKLIEEKKEPVIILNYIENKQCLVKGYEDGRIESDDKNICFYPFKSKINDEKLSAINSDESGQYLAVANDKGGVNVFSIEKLYYDHDDKAHATFAVHKDYIT